MKVAIIKIGETMPGEGLRVRRITHFIDALLDRGHEPHWITSNWNHQKKKRRNQNEIRQSLRSGTQVSFIEANPYQKNLSLRRLWHHYSFSRKIPYVLGEIKPDLIWSCFPTIPSAVSVSEWAEKNNTPVIFDIRDLSPDIFIEHSPNHLKPLLRLATHPWKNQVSDAFARASGIVAVSRDYLKWANNLAQLKAGTALYSEVIPLGYESNPIKHQSDGIKVYFESNSTLTNSEYINIVYSGGFGSSYDIEIIIKTSKLLDEKKVKVNIVVAGGGNSKTESDLRKAQQETSNLHFLGWLDSNDLQYVLSECHVGLMAYRLNATQGMPNKIYEYMGNGLMILNGLRGEAEEFVIEHSIGENYIPEDYANLYSIIIYLESRKNQVKKMGELSRNLFLKEFNLPKIKDKMVDFAERVRDSC